MSDKAESKESGHHITAKGTIIAAVIAAIATIIAAIIVVWFQCQSKPVITPSGNVKPKFVGRVKDYITDTPIRNAKVTLEIQDVPPVIYTDSEGIFSFPIGAQTTELHIRVEAVGYEKFDRRLNPSSNYGVEEIRLQPYSKAENVPKVPDSVGAEPVTYKVYGWIDYTTGGPPSRQTINMTTANFNLEVPIPGKFIGFYLKVQQYTNGKLCGEGEMLTNQMNFPPGQGPVDRSGSPGPYFHGGSQLSKDGRFVEVFLHPSNQCK